MKKIIFDCDNTMGILGCDVDDGLALLYLLGKGTVEILGITATYGNSDVETVYANTMRTLHEIGRNDICLLKGCSDKNCLPSEAVDFIVDTVNANPGEISILATGSLTNLYAAYLADNSILQKTAEIVLMGGITEPLIINGQVLDELNFSCDPAASHCVLGKGQKVTVITGNNCLDAFFTQEEFVQRLAVDKPIAGYIKEKCNYWFQDMMTAFRINGFYNWDVVAAAYIADKANFENHLQELAPDFRSLAVGQLDLAGTDKAIINLPVIRNLRAFTDDVYKAWLSLNLYHSDNF